MLLSDNTKRTMASLLTIVMVISMFFTVMPFTPTYAADIETVLTEEDLSEIVDTDLVIEDGDETVDENVEMITEIESENEVPVTEEGDEFPAITEESESRETDTSLVDADNEQEALATVQGSMSLMGAPIAPLGAGETAQLSGKNVVADAGDEDVTMEISIADCPVFFGMSLRIFYDKSILTLTEIIRGPATLASEGTFEGNIVDAKDGYGTVLFYGTKSDPVNQTKYMTATDGLLFTLVFNVSETAYSGEYDVIIEVDEREGWEFIDPNDGDLSMDIGENGIVGTITISGEEGEALYNGRGYETLESAIDAAAQSGSPGTVKLLKNKTISTFSDRIVIPDGADLTLDLNGHIVTSEVPNPDFYIPQWTVEVEDGAELNLVSTATARGKFVHSTGPEGSTFLVNSGVLNMNNVDVEGFYYGVINGKKIDSKQAAGTYGTFENCDITTIHRPFEFGDQPVEAIKGCRIIVTGGGESDWLGVNMALRIGGVLDLLEDCYIECNESQTIQVGGRIETIKDCEIVNNSVSGASTPAAIYISPGSDIDHALRIGSIIDTKITGMVECLGTIDLITGDETEFTLPEDSEVWNWHNLKVDGNTSCKGSIGEIADGVFRNAQISLFVGNNGVVDTISGGDFKNVVQYYPVWISGGTINTISGGAFTGVGTGIMNQGAIVKIAGGTISGASTALNIQAGATVTTISGGEFVGGSTNGVINSGSIDTISGGTFAGKTYGLRNSKGIIGSITKTEDTEPVFYASISEDAGGDALAVDGTAEVQAKVNSLTAGYYKAKQYDKLVKKYTNATITIPSGYGLSTQPTRPVDLPNYIESAEGYYHFGETVNITWKVDGQADKVDKFVIGDPVYYKYTEPVSDEGPFAGWKDGDGNFYPKDVSLPYAAEDITYTAIFADPAEDYKVSLVNAPIDVYQGQDFTLDVVITSKENTEFQGATIDVTFDNSKVDYDSENSSCEGFGITDKTSGSTTTLTIVGAEVGAEDAYSMASTDDGYAYTLATLAFSAKRNTTGQAVFAIGENAVVDQAEVVLPVDVEKGADVTVTLSQIIVSFEPNGGSAVPQQILNYGDKATEPDKPTKEGCYFQGWYGNSELEGDLFDFDTPIEASMSLYADWGINKYTLTYTAGNNGSLTGTTSQEVEYGNSGTAVTAVPNTGYRFIKWSDDSTANPRTDTNVMGPIAVEAEFAAIEYTITYHLDGGTNHEDNPATYTIESDTITFENATKTGYTFGGWYDAATGGNKVTQIDSGSTGNVDLYAYWTANEYTVTFDAQGGTVEPASKSVTYDVAYGALPTPTKTGHTFLGWFTQADGRVKITGDTTVETANDHTLYALWEHIIYTVTFKAGDHVNMNEAIAYVKHYTRTEDLGLWVDSSCATEFTEPSPVAANGYTLDDPVWKPESGGNVSFGTIKDTQFTDSTTYIATASPSKYDVGYDSDRVNFTSGVAAGKATYLTDIIFTVVKKASYTPVVEYKIGDGEFTPMTEADGKYTIDGSEILGDITIRVTDTLEGEVNLIDFDGYKALPSSHKLLLFSAPIKLTQGAYEYDGEAMFYSSAYSTEDGAQVYLYVVPDTVENGEQAMENIQINGGAELCIELAYDGDVNLDGRLISTDAVLARGLYTGLHVDNPDVSMRMRLEADVDGDKKVDTFDALAVLNKIWGKE